MAHSNIIIQQSMNSSVSLVITILSALLTSAVLMVFIENQHIAANINARYQMIMTPFLHKLSNYFKYTSDVRCTINIINEKSGITDFVKSLKTFDQYSYKTIMSGRDFPIGYFSAIQIDEICNEINRVWHIHNKYQIENPILYTLNRLVNYELTNSYLKEVFPDKKCEESSLEQLAEVSGDFYYKIYSPIKDYAHQYERWQLLDRRFKRFSYGNIVVCVAFLIVTLFFGDCLCGYFIKSFAAISLLLLVITIRRMMRIEKFSNNMFL